MKSWDGVHKILRSWSLKSLELISSTCHTRPVLFAIHKRTANETPWRRMHTICANNQPSSRRSISQSPDSIPRSVLPVQPQSSLCNRGGLQTVLSGIESKSRRSSDASSNPLLLPCYVSSAARKEWFRGDKNSVEGRGLKTQLATKDDQSRWRSEQPNWTMRGKAGKVATLVGVLG